VKSSTKASRVGTKIKYSRCKGSGHNIRRCNVAMVFILLSYYPIYNLLFDLR
jgi:hypothetical protein